MIKSKLNFDEYLDEYFSASIATLLSLPKLSPTAAQVAEAMAHRVSKEQGTVIWFGNGGSASDAEHLSAELVGKFKHERRPIRSIALTTNSSLVTAISNDYGYENLFVRQIEGLARPQDVVVGITTSGKSVNVIKGLEAAKLLGCLTVALTGSFTANLQFVDYLLGVESHETCHIQEGHIVIGQAICGAVEKALLS